VASHRTPRRAKFRSPSARVEGRRKLQLGKAAIFRCATTKSPLIAVIGAVRSSGLNETRCRSP
jgi:hypothetical protein